MPRNIRNTRRNFARPSDTITPASTFAAITFASGAAASSVQVTKKSNPVGPNGNGTYVVTSDINGITGTTTSTATTATVNFSIPGTATSSATTVYISDSNYNGTGKPVAVPVQITPPAMFLANLLVIGGGGSAGGCSGAGTASGGGGAGAYREFSNYGLGTGSNFSVTIGAGGAAGTPGNNPGNGGNTSSFSNINAGGGGYGGSLLTHSPSGQGSGGSGGGAGGTDSSGSITGGQYSAPNNPAIVTGLELYTTTGSSGGSRIGAYAYGGGGGAGAAGAGEAGSPSGGVGRSSSITGTAVFRGGGGGGGQNGAGGNGGGASGVTNSNGTAGTANTGGGGGACYANGANNYAGGAGGSGVVIIRYPNTKTITIGAGLTGSTATDGSFKVTTITAGTGNVSFA